jgi:hypothetical protein
MGVFLPFLSNFLLFLCIYAKKKRIFMNKNAFLVGRGGFEAHQSLSIPLFKRLLEPCPITVPRNIIYELLQFY